jgi:hypothetical protein
VRAPGGRIEEQLEERVDELGHDHADDLFDEDDPEFDDGDVGGGGAQRL